MTNAILIVTTESSKSSSIHLDWTNAIWRQ